MKGIKLKVNDEYNKLRLDVYISEQLEYSRSFIQRLIKEGNISVNGKVQKSNYKVTENDEVILYVPEPKSIKVVPENIPIDIVYEDEDLIIVNKGKNMVVHPSPGHENGTLVNAILYHCNDLSGINGVLRPGIVHRIDKNTTGLLVICKNDFSHINIASQLKEHSITRKYEAIVYNNIKERNGTINAPIGRHPIDRKKMAINYKNGKDAITHYKVLERLNNNKFTYVELQLETGRTHQIRVHMSSISHPIIGDDIYGPKKSPYQLEGQVLHARTLGFVHPRTNKYIEFNTSLPDYFENLLTKLKD